MCFWLSPYLFPTQLGTLSSYFLRALLTQHKQEEQTHVNLVTVVLGSKVASDAGRSGSAAGFRGFQLSQLCLLGTLR